MSSISPLRGEALQQAVDVAVLRKGLDAQKMEGEAAVQLIEQADAASPPQPMRSGNHPDLGNLIDTYI